MGQRIKEYILVTVLTAYLIQRQTKIKGHGDFDHKATCYATEVWAPEDFQSLILIPINNSENMHS